MSSPSIAREIGLTWRNSRYFAALAAVGAGMWWLTVPEGGHLFGAQRPRTLTKEWEDATIMRSAYAPREGAPTPVPLNPFRKNLPAVATTRAANSATWAAETAGRDVTGSKASVEPERAALSAGRNVLSDADVARAAKPAAVPDIMPPHRRGAPIPTPPGEQPPPPE